MRVNSDSSVAEKDEINKRKEREGGERKEERVKERGGEKKGKRREEEGKK